MRLGTNVHMYSGNKSSEYESYISGVKLIPLQVIVYDGIDFIDLLIPLYSYIDSLRQVSHHHIITLQIVDRPTLHMTALYQGQSSQTVTLPDQKGQSYKFHTFYKINNVKLVLESPPLLQINSSQQSMGC